VICQRVAIEICEENRESFEIIRLHDPIIRALYAGIMGLAFKSTAAMKPAIENNYGMIPMQLIRKVCRADSFRFFARARLNNSRRDK
jgi:hypothetical protein